MSDRTELPLQYFIVYEHYTDVISILNQARDSDTKPIKKFHIQKPLATGFGKGLGVHGGEPFHPFSKLFNLFLFRMNP